MKIQSWRSLKEKKNPDKVMNADNRPVSVTLTGKLSSAGYIHAVWETLGCFVLPAQSTIHEQQSEKGTL